MPRITIHVNRPTREDDHVTFSERISAANLDSEHYMAQLIERIAWATADAEAIETGSTHFRRPRSADARTRHRGVNLSERPRVHADV